MPAVYYLRPLFFPLLALAGFWLLRAEISGWKHDYGPLLLAAPAVLGAFLLLLSQLFNQGRIGQTVILVLATYGAIQWQLQTSFDNNAAYILFFWLTLLWPFNMVLIRYLPERRPLSLSGLLFPATLLLQAGIIGVMAANGPLAVNEWILTFRESHSAGLLPLPGLIAIIPAALLIVNRLRSPPDIPFAMLAVLLIHGSMFYGFSLSFVSVLTALISLLLLLGTLLISNHQLAFIDELTALPGRRALMNDLRHRHGRYILVMADIDHFKKFNDTHGHDVGDDVLRLVASLLGKTTGGAKAYRYGGEEFTLIFPATELTECRPFIEATRERIAAYDLVIRNRSQRPEKSSNGKKQRGRKPDNSTLNVTMSFGAARRHSGETIEAVMKRADQALYRAKENGRNRVEDALS